MKTMDNTNVYSIIDFDGTIANTVNTINKNGISAPVFNVSVFTDLMIYLQKLGKYHGAIDGESIKSMFKGKSCYEVLKSIGISDIDIQDAFMNVKIPEPVHNLSYVYSHILLSKLESDPNAYIVSDSFSRSITNVIQSMGHNGIPPEKIYANDQMEGGKYDKLENIDCIKFEGEMIYIVMGDSSMDRQVAGKVKELNPQGKVLFVKTYKDSYHLKSKYYTFLIQKLYSEYIRIIDSLGVSANGKAMYIYYDQALKKLRFSQEQVENTACMIELI